MTDQTAEIYAFIVGTHTIPARFMVEGRAGTMTVPIPSYFVRHPLGDIVFDTGLARASHIDEGGYMSPDAPEGVRFHFSAADELPAQLESAFGIAAEDVALIANSHLHYDHCGGNELFPNARVIVQRREFAHAIDAPSRVVARPRDDFDVEGQSMLLVDGEYDVFGDGSVVLFPSYGHTPGHQSMSVRTADGTYVLAADSCYLQETLDESALPGVIADPQAVLGVLEGYRKMRDEEGARIIVGHDPEFWVSMPLAPKPLRLAV